MFTAVYAPYSYTGKNILWNPLREVKDSFDGPWILLGDFNSFVAMRINKEVVLFPCLVRIVSLLYGKCSSN